MAIRKPLVVIPGVPMPQELPVGDTIGPNMLPAMGGDTGTGGAAGIVPAPPAGSAAHGLFLSGAGAFADPLLPPGGIDGGSAWNGYPATLNGVAITFDGGSASS